MQETTTNIEKDFISIIHKCRIKTIALEIKILIKNQKFQEDTVAFSEYNRQETLIRKEEKKEETDSILGRYVLFLPAFQFLVQNYDSLRRRENVGGRNRTDELVDLLLQKSKHITKICLSKRRRAKKNERVTTSYYGLTEKKKRRNPLIFFCVL